MAEAETAVRIAKRRKMGDRKAAEKWPLIKPKKNLQITRLKDNDLFTVQDFFSSAESKAFVKAAESIGFAHQGSLGPTHGEAYRDNDRLSVNDPVLANAVWESGLSKLFSDIKIRGKVAPVEGMALLHIHGDKCMLHEARNVTKGVKYIFRSDAIVVGTIAHDHSFFCVRGYSSRKAPSCKFRINPSSIVCSISRMDQRGGGFSVEVENIERISLELSWRLHLLDSKIANHP
ncbi:hypothetical protein NC653_035438 [Populus alba x Populus x berolinensis]|uniref:Uncharacterized protein n=1 Tax=Populus alba x Populus x berolinensis TaxID=444605 RepID=A0AAD6LQB6_9ROSI|nr:hypothetical protein NC653_035438 [Populus alba x Populus x berolinensis]